MSSTNTQNIILADYEINGKYCESGLAYPVDATTAKCTSMTSMMYQGKAISEPFPCNPALLNEKCKIMFNIDTDKTYTNVGTRGFVEVPCKCSLGGPNDP